MVDRGTGRRLDWLEKKADRLDGSTCPKKKSRDTLNRMLYVCVFPPSLICEPLGDENGGLRCSFFGVPSSFCATQGCPCALSMNEADSATELFGFSKQGMMNLQVKGLLDGRWGLDHLCSRICVYVNICPMKLLYVNMTLVMSPIGICIYMSMHQPPSKATLFFFFFFLKKQST